jgi:alanine-glyoxylate transaminase/serine-glyoxylate transaminase/serine-pyruvate transaminase
MKYLLMIPGPVEIMNDILEAYKGQPVAHYGPEWTELYLATAEGFSRVIGSEGRTFLMPGSGSLGLETASATFCKSKRCLILNNGMFGDRLFSIASPHSSDIEVIKFPFNAAVDPDTVKKSMKNKKYDVVLMTHVETSTGILNPAKEVASIVKHHGALFVLDAISSTAIEPLEMDNWGIDVTVAASQKGLECPAGLGIITVNRSVLDGLKDTPVNAWYTDLRVWCDYYDRWHDWHPYPVTLPTNTILALSKSIEILEAEGVSARQRRYEDVSKRLRKALPALGLGLYAPEGQYAHGLTAVTTEGKFHPDDLINYLKARFGIQITGSFSELKSFVFRIGHMSRKQCTMISLTSVLNGIACFMLSVGIKVSLEEACSKLVG